MIAKPAFKTAALVIIGTRTLALIVITTLETVLISSLYEDIVHAPFCQFKLLLCFSVFSLVLCYLKAHIHKEPHHILGRVGQKHRDPMELVHTIGGINTVCRSKGAEHLGRQLQIDNVDDLVAVKTELAS